MAFNSTNREAQLIIEYVVGGDFIDLWTTAGQVVTFTGKEAGELAAFLINKFPLDALAQA